MDEFTQRVVGVITATLEIEDQRDTLTSDSPLFGAIPQLDSFTILDLIAALEDEFSIEFDDEDISGESFETVATLTGLVEQRRG